ncbi:MAG TPA: hypothetical protein VGQ05_24220, partial [Streptosporangiaceae bacterium]|nr:hypothetical protein [Streptosporangiaceae bacterium]
MVDVSHTGARGWRNLGEQPVVETPWFRLRQARVELPGGRQLDHYLLRLPPLTMTASGSSGCRFPLARSSSPLARSGTPVRLRLCCGCSPRLGLPRREIRKA